MTRGLGHLVGRLTYEQYRDRLDAREVLAHYDAENCREERNRDGTTEIIHSCLLDRVEPHHSHGDQNPSACLAGNTTIHLIQGKKGQWPLKRTIAEIHQLWHEGIPHHYREGKAYRQTPQGNWAVCVTWRGKKHYLGTFLTEAEAKATVDKFRDEHPYEGRRRYSRNVRVRSWDVAGDQYGRIGTVSDVWQTGVKPLLEITTESGKTLRCTAEHRVYSGEGWVTAGEIRARQDWLFREGRGRDYTKPEVGVPGYLRKAIGVWTQSQRTGIIMPIDCCYLCGQRFPFEELELDHVVSVVEDLARALDVTNLKPICRKCHRLKSSLENGVNVRPGTKLKALPDRVVDVRVVAPEMTYDMEVPDWRNYTANGLVVHNSCNVEKKLYVCYSYWGGDLFHLVMKLEGRESFDDIIPTLGKLLGDATADTEDFKASFLRALGEYGAGAYRPELSAYSERVLAPWAFVHPWLEERGIDVDTASRLNIGWSEEHNRITFPHVWRGRLVGWQMRAIPGCANEWPGTVPDKPKYRSSPGFPKAETLYAPPDGQLATGPVIVVESPMSVARAAALGLEIPVVATFGAKVSATQIKLLKAFEPIYIWMDDDSAGRLAERKLTEALAERRKVLVVESDPGRDLGDAQSLDEVRRKLAVAEPASFAMIRHRQEIR
jgi:hypothetical protein